MTQFIPFDKGNDRLDWLALTQALKDGHHRPKAEIADVFLYNGQNTLLNRSAWISGLGLAVKAATIFPGNAALKAPKINGAVNLFADQTGALEAVIDFHLVTKWKTAGDSLLGALQLARPDSRNILIVGAGTVARSLYHAYSAGFPDARFTVWNRTAQSGQSLANKIGAQFEPDLQRAMAQADIITSATMTTQPVIPGDWIRPGTHVDLIGAYRPDMRETDDHALTKASLFVDSYDTTLGHIGELKIPLASGAITEQDVRADYYQMDKMRRQSDDEITLFKNGGGAHLDLMVSRYILDAWSAG